MVVGVKLPGMKLAGIYKRISDDREGRELGVERQDRDCHKIAAAEEATVVDVYCDNDISASTKSRKPRPDYKRLLADAKSGRINMIIAYTTSRLTRRPREHEDLIDLALDHGVVFRYVRSPQYDLNTAQGREGARTAAARDAGEAEETAERVKAAVVQRAEMREKHGGPRPFGISEDWTEIVEAEAELIKGWYAHILSRGSLLGIVKKLNKAGVLTPPRMITKRTKVNGKKVTTQVDIGSNPWRAWAIRRILLNPRNAGFRVLDGVRYPATHPKIVEEDTWQAVAEILNNKSRKKNHVGTARKHLGTGLFFCERCPGTTVNTGYSQDNVYLQYRCLKCLRQWRADKVNDWVNKLVEDILNQEDGVQRLLPKRATTSASEVRDLVSEREALRRNLKTIGADLGLAVDPYVRETLNISLQTAAARIRQISDQLTRAGEFSAAEAFANSDDPIKKWRETDDLALKQNAIRDLMVITLGTPIRGRAEWLAEKFIKVTWLAEQL